MLLTMPDVDVKYEEMLVGFPEGKKALEEAYEMHGMIGVFALQRDESPYAMATAEPDCHIIRIRPEVIREDRKTQGLFYIIFELFNLMLDEQLGALYDHARNRELTAPQFAFSVDVLEQTAKRKAQAVFRCFLESKKIPIDDQTGAALLDWESPYRYFLRQTLYVGEEHFYAWYEKMTNKKAERVSPWPVALTDRVMRQKMSDVVHYSAKMASNDYTQADKERMMEHVMNLTYPAGKVSIVRDNVLFWFQYDHEIALQMGAFKLPQEIWDRVIVPARAASKEWVNNLVSHRNHKDSPS